MPGERKVVEHIWPCEKFVQAGRISGPGHSAVTFREDPPAELCVDGQLDRRQFVSEAPDVVAVLTWDSTNVLIQTVSSIPSMTQSGALLPGQGLMVGRNSSRSGVWGRRGLWSKGVSRLDREIGNKQSGGHLKGLLRLWPPCVWSGLWELCHHFSFLSCSLGGSIVHPQFWAPLGQRWPGVVEH